MASGGLKRLTSNAYGNYDNQHFPEEKLFPIGSRKIFLTYNVYKGYPKIHLRFYQNDKITGKLYPTPRGITLNRSEYEELKTAVGMMDTFLNPTTNFNQYDMNTRDMYLNPANNFNESDLNDLFADDKMVEECLKNIAQHAEEQNQDNLKREYDQVAQEEFEPTSVKKQKLFYGQL